MCLLGQFDERKSYENFKVLNFKTKVYKGNDSFIKWFG